jgi:hypothetical protein
MFSIANASTVRARAEPLIASRSGGDAEWNAPLALLACPPCDPGRRPAATGRLGPSQLGHFDDHLWLSQWTLLTIQNSRVTKERAQDL